MHPSPIPTPTPSPPLQQADPVHVQEAQEQAECEAVLDCLTTMEAASCLVSMMMEVA